MGKHYDFMREDILETRRKISTGEIKYALEVEVSVEDLMKGLEEILDKDLKDGEWEGCLQDIYEEINEEIDGGIEEKEFHKKIMINISEIISNVDSYIYDLWADVYLAILRTDSQNDVKPDDQMKLGWDSKACNSRIIDVEKAKIHYPLVDYGNVDFPISGIPGGCKEYHSIMMQQKNIGLFDIDSEKESLKQYAYPKSHDLYRELADSSVENLLLLEKTLGIGYVNHLFHYLKDISSKDRLEGMKKIIESVTEMPMFIRKGITDVIWTYLLQFEYSDASIECIERSVGSISYMIDVVYKKMWQFVWQICECGVLPWGAMKGTLIELWKGYFNETEVYDYFLESKNLYGWRDVENVETCFIKCGENGQTLLAIDRKGEKIADILAEKQERIQYFMKKEDNEKTGGELLQEVFLELKEQENAIWEGVDPKRKTKKLAPMDVYAVVHEDVIRVLNC